MTAVGLDNEKRPPKPAGPNFARRGIARGGLAFAGANR